jgi:tetratricopeptide (TPR) repeat protein
LFRLGEVLLRENKPKDSLDIYTRAARLQKPGAEQLRLVAMDYALLKLYNDAIHWLQIAHSMDAGNVDIMYDLGRCLYTQSRFHEAEQIFSEVLQRKPDSIKAEENLALTLDKELESQRAEAAFRKAVEWTSDRPADEWPFLNLGAFLLDHARATESIPFLRKAINIAPANAVGHEKLGRALLQIDDVPSGLTELQTAARIDTNNPRIHFELGRAYRDAGQNEKAAAEFALSKTLYGAHSEE